MNRLFIEEVRYGVTEGGMACGPVSGNPVVTARYTDGEETGWLSVVEVDGIPNVFQTDRDIFEDLVREDLDDEEFIGYLHQHSICLLDGPERDNEDCPDGTDDPAMFLIRYLAAVAECDEDELEKLIWAAENRFADELEIPKEEGEL